MSKISITIELEKIDPNLISEICSILQNEDNFYITNSKNLEENNIFNREQTTKDEVYIKKLLVKLGVSPGLSIGYKYIIEIIKICLRENIKIDKRIIKIYDRVSEQFNITSASVAHAIRYSITRAWQISEKYADIKAYQEKIFPIYNGTYSPTPIEFLRTLIIKIENYQKSQNDNK